MVIQLPQNVKNILDKYDINALITRTIPEKYLISKKILNIYKTKTKFDTPVTITLTDAATQVLKSLADNYPTYSHNEILSYLIENVCDASKIQSKQVAHALDSYYYMFAEASNRNSAHHDYYRSLFRKFSELYFYDTPTSTPTPTPVSLSDEHIATFLTLSSDGQALVREINNKRD